MLNSHSKTLILIFALLGFGAKAGLVPLHAWLPKAHPSAPSNISALMSGVMLKIALYGFIRVAFVFIKGVPLSIGILILIIGGISAVYSILNGLFQDDIKKLLAYSSAENIGIIFSTLGLAMIFNYYKLNTLEILALTAALFHILNHAVFKSLLFTGAGSVLYGTSSKNMNELGGLYNKMKFVAICTFIGTAAITAIPPFNGFASEILILKSFIEAGQAIKNPETVFIIFSCGVTLAITSGLVMWSAVKSFGITFLGMPRSVKAKEVHRVPLSMNIGMGILSIYVILLGVLSPLAIKVITKISNNISGIDSDIYGKTLGFEVTIITLIFIGIIALILIFNKLTAGDEKLEYNDTWGCGFNNMKPYMQYSGNGFTQPGARLIGNFVGYEKEVRIKNTIFIRQKFVDLIEKYLYGNVIKLFNAIGKKIIKIHYGKIQAYISYIFVSLIVAIILVYKFV
jgi:hydrogenase-4 component B